jgi:hypothetical protein
MQTALVYYTRHLLSDKAFPWLLGQSDHQKALKSLGFRAFLMLKIIGERYGKKSFRQSPD